MSNVRQGLRSGAGLSRRSVLKVRLILADVYAMAHKGPILPRKATGIARSDESFRSVAFQIGTLVAIERNRVGWTQDETASRVGLEQVDVSRVENGKTTVSDNRKRFRSSVIPSL